MEDERFELDLIIEHNISAMRVLQQVVNKSAQLGYYT
jgi:histone deacetylase complex regulatory component SIN3